MGKIKISRKELKEDEIQEWGTLVVLWLQSNVRSLAILAGLVVALIAIVFVYKSQKDNALYRLNAQFAMAYNSYSIALRASTPEERVDRLQRAATSFQEVAINNPSSTIGHEAGFLHANALYYLENYTDSREAFNLYLRSATDGPDRARAHLGLGDCFVSETFSAESPEQRAELLQQGLGSYDSAIEAAGNSYLAYYAMMKKARILEQDPETVEQARAIYTRIQQERPADNAAIIERIDPKQITRQDAEEIRKIEESVRATTLESMAENLEKQLNYLDLE